MAGYIVLANYTKQGIDSIQESPTRLKQIRALAESMGIKMIGSWLTMGQYDVVSVFDAPNDETMAQLALTVGRAGNVTTHTMRAFSEEELARIVSGVRSGLQ